MSIVVKELPTTVPTPSEPLMKLYQSGLKALNRSPKTIAWYLEILKRYFDFLSSKGLAKPIRELGTTELNAYILYLQQATRWANNPHLKNKGQMSPYSVQGYVRAIKAFWSWLYNEGYVETNPLAIFKLPKVPKKLIPVLTIEQIKKLFAALDRSTSLGARNYLILLLLLDTGVRISELVQIRMSDFDSLLGSVKVTGKGSKERMVYVSRQSRKELVKYTKNTRAEICQATSEYLFPAKDGEHITINSVQQTIRRLVEKAGLHGVECHPHTFRHTFATMFLAKGGQTLVLKEILGHESIQTTEKYIHLQSQDLQKHHEMFSPLQDLFKD
jgi:integrase/recombinase XerD